MHRIQIVTVKSQPLNCRSTVEIEPRRMHYKTHQNARCWIANGRSLCVFCQFNIDRYNSSLSTAEIKTQSHESNLATYPPPTEVKINRCKSLCNRMLLRLPHRLLVLTVDCDTIGRSRSRHVTCVFQNNLKILFKLEKSIFNSVKSLEMH